MLGSRKGYLTGLLRTGVFLAGLGLGLPAIPVALAESSGTTLPPAPETVAAPAADSSSAAEERTAEERAAEERAAEQDDDATAAAAGESQDDPVVQARRAAERALAAKAAAEAADAAFTARLGRWQEDLDNAAALLGRRGLKEEDYETLRTRLSEVFDQARDAVDERNGQVEALQAQIEALGAAPGENDPPEDPAVAETRKTLNQDLSRQNGDVHQAGLMATRADILLKAANERRIAQFAESLLRQGASPLEPAVWGQLPAQIRFLEERWKRAWAFATADHALLRQSWYEEGIMLAVMLAAGLMLHWRGLQPLQTRIATPTLQQRKIRAGLIVVMAGILPLAVLATLLSGMLRVLDSLPLVLPLRNLFLAASAGVAGLVLTAAVLWAMAAPGRSGWRLLPKHEAAVPRLIFRDLPLLAVLAMAGAVLTYLELALVAPELHAVAGFLARLAGAVAVFLLLLGVRGVPQRLRFLILLTAVTVVILAALRYHNLSLYCARFVLAGLGTAGLISALRAAGREGLRLFLTRSRGWLARLRNHLFPGPDDQRLLTLGLYGLWDGMLAVTGLTLMLPVSGIVWSEIEAWITAFLHGFTIGQVTIAPLDIFSALILMAAVLMISRVVQRRVDESFLQRFAFDRGVRNSIRTGIGYFGVLLAGVVGIGALGLNLSSLTMIASALSVGIGFGLQAVVSNFVAGLILLVERPIKVGDWVVVGDREGVVRRISVRSTEIQTFQRSSVIVPNAELVSGTVVNWTHKDKFGRIDIPVGLAYDCDCEQVRAVLLACARAQPQVVAEPPPQVLLRQFGASTLDFELRCFVADVDVYLSVSSALRFAILAAFRTHGIDIPCPQQVVHIPALEAWLAHQHSGQPAAPLSPQAT